MDTYTLFILGTVLATGLAAKQTKTVKPMEPPNRQKTTTVKPMEPPNSQTFLGKLQDLGQRLVVEAVVKTVPIVCRECPRLCEERIGQPFCRFVCAPCDVLVKRSVEQPNKGHLTPMPNKFSSYDLNDDGVVSMKELAFVTGPGSTAADVEMVFSMADTNGDKVLTPKELYEGPFVFEMDVSDNDYMYCKYVAKRMSRNSKQQTVA